MLLLLKRKSQAQLAVSLVYAVTKRTAPFRAQGEGTPRPPFPHKTLFVMKGGSRLKKSSPLLSSQTSETQHVI